MKKIIIVLLCLFTLTGCTFIQEKPLVDDETDEVSFDLSTVEKGDIQTIDSSFNIGVFEKTFNDYIKEQKQNENYMISPLSLKFALGLLIIGASKETKAELLEALGKEKIEELYEDASNFFGFIDMVDKNCSAEKELLGISTREKDCTINIANSIWNNTDSKGRFINSYIDAVEKHFNGQVYSIEAARMVSEVNKWVNLNTKGLIPVLLDDNFKAEENVALLINTLYLKDSWLTAFEENTIVDDFTCFDNTVTRKEYMHANSNYKFYQDDSSVVTIIPLNGSIYLAAVMGDDSDLKSKIEKSENTKLLLSIPKFEITTSLTNKEVVNYLITRDVKYTFDETFSGFELMIENEDVYVSDIIQKTKIKVDQNGVEAAAVSSISISKTTSIEPTNYQIVSYNKPFSFYIYTTINNSTEVLFVGNYGK